MPERLLVLDADGVFLDERPYWNAALATALLESGRGLDAAEAWDGLASAAFGEVGLQRAAKRRGCNSNHDLAAVLARALEDPGAAAAFDRELAAGNPAAAAAALDEAASRTGDARTARSGDPLASFGIARRGGEFERVVARFQRIMSGDEPELDWPFAREALRDGLEETRGFLGGAADAGWSLRVCTGRPRAEIDPPIRRLGLGEWLPPSCVTSADEVRRAEAIRPGTMLGKPHPFPVWCAVAGEDAAGALLDGRPVETAARGVFVGDALADAIACRRARETGMDVRYVHVRSPATDDATLAEIESDAATLGIVDRLAGLLPLLREGRVA